MTVIGLTGNIGCGKTLAAALLKKYGAYIIDADQVARKVVEPGRPASDEIRSVFGDEYFWDDGNINRKMLGEKVFSFPGMRKELNKITHPRIKKEIEKEMLSIYEKDRDAIIILEAAILIEMELMSMVDTVWLVKASVNNIIRRLEDRDAFSCEETKKRLSSQMSPVDQERYADKVFVNDGCIEDFERQLKEAYQDILKKNR